MVTHQQASELKFGGLMLVGVLTVATLSVLYIPIRADVINDRASRNTLNTVAPAEELVTAINALRAQHGLEPLQTSSALAAAAVAHATDMATRNYYSHTSPDGKTPHTRMIEAGYKDNGMWAETIATHLATPRDAVTAWQEDSTDLTNLLNPNVSDIGTGVGYSTSTKTWYYVALFAASSGVPAASPDDSSNFSSQ